MEERYGVRIKEQGMFGTTTKIWFKYKTREEAEESAARAKKEPLFLKVQIVDLKEEAKKEYNKLLKRAEKLKEEWNF